MTQSVLGLVHHQEFIFNVSIKDSKIYKLII
jgi:hypothetical protein